MTQMKTHTDVPFNVAAPVLLLSRAELSLDQFDQAEALCKNVQDWQQFSEIAMRKFSLPWIHAHMSKMDPNVVPEGFREFWQVASTNLIMSTLKVNAVMAVFHKTCIQPLGVDHIYLKGPSLAARYYDNPTLRFSRDIDMLVSPDDFEAVVRKALSEGYKMWIDPDDDPYVPTERDTKAALRYNDVISLMSPEDVVIEIHREVDKHSGLFETHDLLKDVETVKLGDVTVNVLPTAALLSYVCYHNTRHIWSRLHWLADLDAITQDPSYDRAVALAYADAHGLGPTVEACLDFCELSARPNDWDTEPATTTGKQMLDLCISNLGGDLELEYSLRSRYGFLGLPFDWMVSSGLRWKIIWRHIMIRLKPNYAQYSAWPLPEGLQWLYYLTRPMSGLKRRLVGKAD